METITFKTSVFDEIIDKINYSLLKFENDYKIFKDIEILIPSYFITMFTQRHQALTNLSFSDNKKPLLFGCEIGNSPYHKIIIFHKDLPMLNLNPIEIDLKDSQYKTSEEDVIYQIDKLINSVPETVVLNSKNYRLKLNSNDFKAIKSKTVKGKYKGIEVRIDDRIPNNHFFIN